MCYCLSNSHFGRVSSAITDHAAYRRLSSRFFFLTRRERCTVSGVWTRATGHFVPVGGKLKGPGAHSSVSDYLSGTLVSLEMVML